MSGTHLAMVTLVVPDYQQGLDYFTGALGFDVLEDTDLGGGKRWVVVGAADGARVLLAQAANEEQRAAVGRQAGGRVGFFLHTGDFAATHAEFTAQGVEFEEAPRLEPYGTVAVFRDAFGNRWDLVEHRTAA